MIAQSIGFALGFTIGAAVGMVIVFAVSLIGVALRPKRVKALEAALSRAQYDDDGLCTGCGFDSFTGCRPWCEFDRLVKQNR